MRLTEKKAIDISIELWAWLAETGNENKGDWAGWEKYGEMDGDCALCEYDMRRKGGCASCPYHDKFGVCLDGVFGEWDDATKKSGRKKYANLFLEQLYQLKEGYRG